MKSITVLSLFLLLTDFSMTQTVPVDKNDQATVSFSLAQIDSIMFSTVASSTPLVLFSSNRDGNWEIYSCNIDGSNIQRLTNNPAYDEGGKMNPLRNKIGFQSDRGGQLQLYVMNLDGSSQTMVSSRTVDGFGWTTDNKIIFSADTHLYKVNPDGTNEVQIATAPSGKRLVGPICSPVSHLISAIAIGSWGYDRTTYLMNDDGSNMRVFIPDAPGGTYSGGFSPDGLRLSYAYDISGHEDPSGRQLDDHIFLINIDGTGHVDISVNKPANTNDVGPVFTPDGTKILFRNNPNDESALPDIWIMNTDGTNRTKIVTNGIVSDCTREGDTQPPTISVTLSPTELWPPDHKLRDITASISVTDNLPGTSYVLKTISSNEPDDGLGDGDMPFDVQEATLGIADVQFKLRAERSGLGKGRVYTITYTATDAAGNSTDATATVKVPKSKSKLIPDGRRPRIISSENSAMPDHFALHQNSPNPFNPTTRISFELPLDGDVSLKVYDILGQEVATLVNGRKEAGRYEVEFDAGRLPSGVYFYRLQTKEFTQTRKLLLMR